MKSALRTISISSLLVVCALAQPSTRYSIGAAAGSPHVTGDNGPATAAVLRSPQYITVDRSGNLYISEGLGYTIRKIAPDGTIATVAGTGVALSGPDGAQAASSPLAGAEGLAFDSNGNLYVAELYLRKISTNGVLSTVAGRGNSLGDGGPATASRLSGAQGMRFDQAGNLYIADTGNNRIRKIDTNGIITTVAGGGSGGDGGSATAAQLNQPSDVAVDASGNLYIADRGNNRVRVVTPAGVINTYAGTGVAGSGGDNFDAASAQLNGPAGLALDSAGRLYVSESVGNRIRRITPTATGALIERIAGPGNAGPQGEGALAASAILDAPWGIALDSAGNLYFAEGGASQRIRKVTAAGLIYTVAGASHFAGDGGPATSARLGFPESVAMDNSGNLYIADRQNHRIRKITPDGSIHTIAGNGTPGYAGDKGPAGVSILNAPAAVAVDGAGNLYISDTANARVRMIDSAGIITTVAGNGIASGAGDGGQATSAGLNLPKGLAIDSAGNLYIADQGNNRIRMVNANGVISTLAGTGVNGFGGDGGPSTAALLSSPDSVAVAPNGNLYIADTSNYVVRKIDLLGHISTVAGNRQATFGGDNGPATAASLENVASVGLDSAGNLFIGDPGNARIRMVNSSGIISTVAGSGTPSSAGDGGPATAATLGGPVTSGYGFTFGPAGVVYFADTLGEEIRKLTPSVASQLNIVSGNNQSGATGTQLPNPLLVGLLDALGIPVAGVSVTFTVTSGSAQLSATSSVTDSKGQATVNVTLGSAVGPVTVTAVTAGVPSVAFNLTVTATTGPQISAGGVVGAGLSVPPVTQLSSGAIVSIFGQNFAPAGSPLAQVGAGDLVGGQVPTLFAGVCVEVNGQRAPILAVLPGQVNIQVPAIPQSGSVPVVVIANCGQSTEARSAPVTVPAQAATPEFFFFVQNANGQNPVAAEFSYSVAGAYVGPAGLLPGATFIPARPGDVVVIFMTGLGATSPSYAPGVLPPGGASLIAPASVSLGALQLPAANTLYAGVAPLTPGQYQVNIQIPAGAPTGNVPLTVTVGTFSTPPGGYLAIGQ